MKTARYSILPLTILFLLLLCCYLYSADAGNAVNPRVAIIMSEQNNSSEGISSLADDLSSGAAENILTAVLIKRGYSLVDKDAMIAVARRNGALKPDEKLTSQETALRVAVSGGADILFIGRAVAKAGALPLSGTNMKSSQATVTIKMVETSTGRVLASQSATGTAANVNPTAGGEEAIKKAAKDVSEFLGRQLSLKWGKPEKQLAATTPAETKYTHPAVPIAPPVVQADTTPPVIEITSPDVQRSLKQVVKTASIVVTGRATDSSGVASVSINGQPASLDENGNFSADILLKVGENQITVSAMDTRRNITNKNFALKRDIVAGGAQKAAPVEPSLKSSSSLGAGRYYALLIAVQDYANSDINKLDHPINDARALKDILVTRYTFDEQNVMLLENPDAKGIGKAFNDLRVKLTDQDNLIVFYAGHGVWMEDMKEGFWLPRDASGPNDPTGWMPNSTIRNYIRAIKAKHLLLVADACFSGGIFKVRDAFSKPNTSIEKIYEMPSRKAITSGALKTVPDKSVFLEYLRKRLTENQDDFLDSQKLFISFKEAVINNSPNAQTPLYGAINEAGDEGGDFVFIKRK